MLKTVTLSDAQANVLSGPVDFNADGSIAVTSGRENTLASLRKLGLLNGNLLTGNGNNARVSVQSGSRKVTVSEDGNATCYLPPVETAAAPVEAEKPVTLSRPMQTTGDTIPWGAEHVWTHTADWTLGMAHGAFKIYRMDENAAYGELGDGIKWYATAEFSGSRPVLLCETGSLEFAMTACAREHWAHARTVVQNTETLPGVRVASITHGEVTVNFLGDNAVRLPAQETPAPVDANGTPYTPGCEVESVSKRRGTNVPLSRGMVMRITDDGRPVVSFYGEGDELDDVRPDCFVITSTPDAQTAVSAPEDLPLSLSLTPMADGRLMARVGAYEKPFRADPTAKLHASFWARGKGARGNGKAGRFDWHRAGHGVMTAGAHFA